jgi:hypothetical protein
MANLNQSQIPNIMLEAHALLAVGMDGTVVVLEVNSDNTYLDVDARLRAGAITDVIKFMPDAFPQGPGLYEFRGFTAPEPNSAAGFQFVHRGRCSKVAC